MGPLVVLAALGEEAGALERRLGVPVLPTGVGKVAAAMHTQRVIGSLSPAGLVFVGVAGGLAPDLGALSVVVARDTVQWDVDITAVNGGEPGTLNDGRRFLPLDPEGARLALEAARGLGLPARLGRVASGDAFVADPDRAAWIRRTFRADAVEMEGAAAVQVAADNSVPVVLVRVVSDGAGEAAELAYEVFLERAAERAAEVVAAFLPAWADDLARRASRPPVR